jgi:outer membrane protein assembly factor BamB
MRTFVIRRCLAILAISCFYSAANSASDWPNWRGTHFNASTDLGDYPEKWDAAHVSWKVKLPGKSSSSPIVYGSSIYITTPAEGQDAVMAFNRSGETLWQTRLGPESPPKHRTLGSSSNASPVTDGEALYAYFKSGTLASLKLDGTVRWQINLVERFGREQLFWDAGTSPVLTDRHVIIARMHGGESWLAAFDKATGEMAWQQPRNYETPTENDNGYTTPIVFDHGNEKALLVWGAEHLTAHKASNGELLWSCGGFNPAGTGYWPAIASPVIVGNMVVVPVGRDDRPKQSSLYGVRLGGSGDVTKTHQAWKREDVGVFVSSPAAYQGRVYLLRHRGDVVCLNPATGESHWEASLPKASAPYYASPVIANGVLYAAREDGVVFAARIDDGFKVLSENPMGERIVASPVPAHGGLLLRGDDHLFCIKDRGT